MLTHLSVIFDNFLLDIYVLLMKIRSCKEKYSPV